MADQQNLSPRLTDAQRAERRKKRNASKKVVRAFMQTIAGDEDQRELYNSLKFLVGAGFRAPGAGGTTSKRTIILEAVTKAGKDGLSEMDLFKQFRIGRPEMQANVRYWIRNPKNKADRVWVGFDETKEVYGVVGKGATPPKGWTGYVPDDEKEDL
jgi:hypothetical protein